MIRRYYPTRVHEAMQLVGMWPIAVEVDSNTGAVCLLIGTVRHECRLDLVDVGRQLEQEVADAADAELKRLRQRVAHVCCGCGGLCDSGVPCPMAYNCACRGAVQ